MSGAPEADGFAEPARSAWRNGPARCCPRAGSSPALGTGSAPPVSISWLKTFASREATASTSAGSTFPTGRMTTRRSMGRSLYQSDNRRVEPAAPPPAVVDLEVLAARAAAAGTREDAWDLLDAAGAVDLWCARILDLIDRSDLTMATLLKRRALEYGGKALFEIPGPGTGASVSWRQTSLRVDAIARGLLALAGTDARVAIVSGNRLEMALCDLACHAAGLVSVLIPTSATEADIAAILTHAGATVAIVSER